MNRPGYRRFLDRIARESDPAAVPAAAQALLELPGADAQRGVVDLWERSVEETRPDLAETVLSCISMESDGAVRTLITVARGLDGEMREHQRSRVRDRLTEIRDAGALRELRTWQEEEEDPEIRHSLEEAIHRIEAETEPR